MAPTDKKLGAKAQATRKLFSYSPSKVAKALDAIRGGMKVAAAARNFQVPRTTLRHKISGRAPETTGHVGPQAVLGKGVENALKVWLKECSRAGFPINKECLLDSVKKIVETGNLQTPFIDNRPGRSWFEAFMARHPDLSHKHAEYINKARAMVTEEKIRKWFEEVADLIGPENSEILREPQRVWNCDETSFFLAPKGGLILAPKGEHVYDTSKNSDKENITTLFTVNANGECAPPLTLYKYKRMNQEVVQNAPKNWSVGKTDKGWMTGESFYEYIGNVFLPYLQENSIKSPVILFLDGHKSHLTLHLSKLCRENGIIVVALVPNTTHMMQPLDVAVFFPLKQKWVKYVRKWRIDNNGQEITKFNLPSALNDILFNGSQSTDPNFANNVKAGFATCGIFPFGPENVNYKRIIKHPIDNNRDTTCMNNTENTGKVIEESSHLEYLESKIQPELLNDFQDFYQNGLDWTGCTEAAMLYTVWMAFRDDNSVPQTRKEPNSNELNSSNTSSQTVYSPSILNDTQLTFTTSFNDPNSTVTIDPKSNAQLKVPVLKELNTDFSEPSTSAASTNDHQNIFSTPTSAKLSTPSRNIASVPSSSKIITPITSDIDLVKSCVVWPEKKSSNTNRKREYIPSVLTSAKWQEIMTAKEAEKEDKEEKKRMRKDKIKKKCERQDKRKESSTDEEQAMDISEHSSENEDWIPEPRPSGFEELERSPKEGDYVLVEFKGSSKNLLYYYVGKIIHDKDNDNDLEVSYLRKGKKSNTFVMPSIPDLACVAESDIKMILPSPAFTKGTKRQNAFVSFEIDLSGYNMA